MDNELERQNPDIPVADNDLKEFIEGADESPESFLEAVTGQKCDSVEFDADQAKYMAQQAQLTELNAPLDKHEVFAIKQLFKDIEGTAEKGKMHVRTFPEFLTPRVEKYFKDRGFWFNDTRSTIKWG